MKPTTKKPAGAQTKKRSAHAPVQPKPTGAIIRSKFKVNDSDQAGVLYEAMKGANVTVPMQGAHAVGGVVLEAGFVGARPDDKTEGRIASMELCVPRARGTGGHAAGHDMMAAYMSVPVRMFPQLRAQMDTIESNNKQRKQEAKIFKAEQEAKQKAALARKAKKAAKTR